MCVSVLLCVCACYYAHMCVCVIVCVCVFVFTTASVSGVLVGAVLTVLGPVTHEGLEEALGAVFADEFHVARTQGV